MKSEKTTDSTAALAAILRKWQGLEDATVAQTTAIIEKTKNPLIRTVMEIIRADSQTHKHVQQVMLDGLEKQAFTLTPEELGDIWDMVTRHADMERETIKLAEEARRSCRLFVHRHLLSYLLDDERKHDRLLTDLEDFKRGIYPYA